MSAKTKKPKAPTTDWSVVRGAAGYILKWKNLTVDIQKGIDGNLTLTAQAQFANERGLVPDKASCNADPSPRRTSAGKVAEQISLFEAANKKTKK